MATTLAVIVWLRSKFIESYDEWEMIEKKALAWLHSKLRGGAKLDELLDQVKERLWPYGVPCYL